MSSWMPWSSQLQHLSASFVSTHMLSIEWADEEDHQLENPKNQPIFRWWRTFFFSLRKENFHHHRHQRVYVYARAKRESDPRQFADEPSECWQFGDRSSIRSSSGPLSRCVAINTRRDNVTINFGALLHEQRDYKPNYRAVDIEKYPWTYVPFVNVTRQVTIMLWRHVTHNSIWADWKMFFQQHGATVSS